VGFGFASAQPAPGAVFTAEQADAGRTLYAERCASCHMADLGGRDDAPPLAGEGFLAAWKARTTRELFEFIRDTMPPDGPALAPDDALRTVAHVLRQNGATPGSEPLTATTAAAIGSIATGRKPGPAHASARVRLASRPHGAPACVPSRTSAC
jgi:mono/diheme cytochrome c family protein